MGDEAESHRIIDAREREDAFLEKAVMEGDMRVENNTATVPGTPNVNFPAPTTVTPPTPRMEPASLQASSKDDTVTSSHEEMLDDNYVHEIVNQDQEMYDAIDDVSNWW